MASSFTSALTKAKKKKKHSAPADPPAGTYDPLYDAQGRQNQRGYDDLLQDFGISKQRATDDLGISLGNLGQEKANTLADLDTSHTRNLAALLTGRTRATEDYQRAGQDLGRQYGVLAHRQTGAARQAHADSAGILAQSLRKRLANQALDQGRLDTSYHRQQADSTTAEQQTNEDYTRGTTRTEENATNRGDALKLAFDRAFGPSGDNVLNLGRAGRDLVQGGLDLNAQKWYSAVANGYTPPTRRKRRLPQVV